LFRSRFHFFIGVYKYVTSRRASRSKEVKKRFMHSSTAKRAASTPTAVRPESLSDCLLERVLYTSEDPALGGTGAAYCGWRRGGAGAFVELAEYMHRVAARNHATLTPDSNAASMSTDASTTRRRTRDDCAVIDTATARLDAVDGGLGRVLKWRRQIDSADSAPSAAPRIAAAATAAALDAVLERRRTLAVALSMLGVAPSSAGLRVRLFAPLPAVAAAAAGAPAADVSTVMTAATGSSSNADGANLSTMVSSNSVALDVCVPHLARFQCVYVAHSRAPFLTLVPESLHFFGAAAVVAPQAAAQLGAWVDAEFRSRPPSAALVRFKAAIGALYLDRLASELTAIAAPGAAAHAEALAAQCVTAQPEVLVAMIHTGGMSAEPDFASAAGAGLDLSLSAAAVAALGGTSTSDATKEVRVRFWLRPVDRSLVCARADGASFDTLAPSAAQRPVLVPASGVINAGVTDDTPFVYDLVDILRSAAFPA
jgi:hypothetical protein